MLFISEYVPAPPSAEAEPTVTVIGIEGKGYAAALTRDTWNSEGYFVVEFFAPGSVGGWTRLNEKTASYWLRWGTYEEAKKTAIDILWPGERYTDPLGDERRARLAKDVTP